MSHQATHPGGQGTLSIAKMHGFKTGSPGMAKALFRLNDKGDKKGEPELEPDEAPQPDVPLIYNPLYAAEFDTPWHREGVGITGTADSGQRPEGVGITGTADSGQRPEGVGITGTADSGQRPEGVGITGTADSGQRPEGVGITGTADSGQRPEGVGITGTADSGQRPEGVGITGTADSGQRPEGVGITGTADSGQRPEGVGITGTADSGQRPEGVGITGTADSGQRPEGVGITGTADSGQRPEGVGITGTASVGNVVNEWFAKLSVGQAASSSLLMIVAAAGSNKNPMAGGFEGWIPNDRYTDVNGTVGMGKAVAGLSVQAIDANGNVVAQTQTNANGQYTLTLNQRLAGQVLTVKVQDAVADGQGYLDEVTREQKDLLVQLRAKFALASLDKQTVNVTHATEIAAQLADDLRLKDASGIALANQTVGSFLNVNDIVTDSIDFADDAQSNPYGNALALLSAFDAVNERIGHNNPTQATVKQIATLLQANGNATTEIKNSEQLQMLSQAVGEWTQARPNESTLTAQWNAAFNQKISTEMTPVFITSSSNLIGSNKTTAITFTFGQAPNDTVLNQLKSALQVQGGSLGSVTGAGKTYTATFTQSGNQSPWVQVNSNAFFANTVAMTLDDQAPVLSIGSIRGYAASDTLFTNPLTVVKAGDVLRVVLNADEAVQVGGNGTPTLQLQVGTQTVTANYLASASGSKTLVFQTTVGTNWTDSDGVSLVANGFALNGATLTDLAGNAANTRGLSSYGGLSVQVDTTAPTVLSQIPADNTTVGNAGVAHISLAFSESVKLGSGSLSLKNSSGATLQTWAVESGTLSADGQSLSFPMPAGIPLAAGSYSLSATPGSLTDLAGNALDVNKLSADGTWGFSVGSVSLSINKVSNDNLLNKTELNSDIQFTGTYASSDASLLTGLNTSDLTVMLRPIAGGNDRYATVQQWSNGKWTATVTQADAQALSGGYVVKASIATSAVQSSASSVIMVDTEAQIKLGMVAGDSVVSRLEQAIIGTGKALNIGFVAEKGSRVRFEFIKGEQTKTTLETLGTGQLDTQSLSLTKALIDGLGAGAAQLKATVTDAAGNTNTSTQDFSVENLSAPAKVVSTRMLINNLPVTSDTWAKQGQWISLMLSFDQAVTVTDPQNLRFNFLIGNTPHAIPFRYMADAKTLVFAYQVTSSDVDADGISHDPNALNSGQGRIKSINTGEAVELGVQPPVSGPKVYVYGPQLHFTGSVTEAGMNATPNSVVSGQLAPAGVMSAQEKSGTYGRLVISSDGSYRYELDNEDLDTQALKTAGQALEIFTFSVQGGLIADLTITVFGANDAPTAPALTNQSVQIGKTLNYTFADFNDPDGDSLLYTASLSNGDALPSWLSFSNVSLRFSGTPPAGTQTGDLEIKVTANDGHNASASAIFKLSVLAADSTLPTPHADTAAVTEAGGRHNDFQPNGSSPQTSGNVLSNDVAPSGIKTVVKAQRGAVQDLADLSQSIAVNTTSTSAEVTTLQGNFGLLKLGSDGSYLYSVNQTRADSLGAGTDEKDVFTYEIQDGQGGTARTTLTITVYGTNDAPYFASGVGLVDQSIQAGSMLSYAIPEMQDPDDTNILIGLSWPMAIRFPTG